MPRKRDLINFLEIFLLRNVEEIPHLILPDGVKHPQNNCKAKLENIVSKIYSN